MRRPVNTRMHEKRALKKQRRSIRREEAWQELERHYADSIASERKSMGGVGRLMAGRSILQRHGYRLGRFRKARPAKQAIPAGPSMWRQARDSQLVVVESVPMMTDRGTWEIHHRMGPMSKREAKLRAYPRRCLHRRRRHGRQVPS